MTTAERVQKHRAKLQVHQRKRFEATVDMTVLQKMIAVAGALQVPVWKVVERALTDYGNEFDALIAEQRRLREERPRVAQCGSSVEVETFNEDLKRYNDRVSRLPRHPVSQTGRIMKP